MVRLGWWLRWGCWSILRSIEISTQYLLARGWLCSDVIVGLQDAHLALGKGENKLFVVLRKDEAVGCALIVFDVFHEACHGVKMGAEWCKAIL